VQLDCAILHEAFPDLAKPEDTVAIEKYCEIDGITCRSEVITTIKLGGKD
jgi:hypothetical protein